MKEKTFDFAFIFDLDGCIFDDEWRLHLIKKEQEGPARYDAYHQQLSSDKMLPLGSMILGRAVGCGAFIFFVTARPEAWKPATISTIEAATGLRNNIDFSVIMRKDNDLRHSPELKTDLAQAVIEYCHKHGIQLVGAFDDRDDVVSAYCKSGIDAFILNAKFCGADEDFWQLTDYRDHSQANPATLPVTTGPLAIQGAASLEPVADLMDLHAQTFRERYESYGNNAEVVGRLQQALFPNGVVLKTAKDHEMWHLFELMLVKITRFAGSGLNHEDSINDIPAYAAMVHNLINSHSIEFTKETNNG